MKLELIPGTDTYLDKKGFRWDLAYFGSDAWTISITFEHPEFISCDKIDSMKIKFNNTALYLQPADLDSGQ